MPKPTSHPVLDFCRNLPGVTEDVKWGNDLVFSVGGKMFAAFGLPDYEPFSFKVHPAVFGTLTQQEGIRPAPYLAQHSWVSVASLSVLSTEEITALIQESYALVAQKLPKKIREKLGITAL
ncbi:MAG TPA: MmcQ/YjbR family DNA-binding protein [Thermoanaerobaculia bacterium]|nr:MmcQ/YjbR family DNA-binding protein [Thermoanaerobaculia bacterium]